jgi:uncharacterized protein YjbI with pentapeptide repeats
MTLLRARQADEGARPKWRPIPFWPWTLAAASAVVIGASVAIILLLTIASGAKPGTDRANARLDAVRTGLAVGAGIGAAAGLVLAFRRQHHQEVATDLTDRDATERRITELYTKAVEQLGSDKAPVRLGGLYALERLAQDNPAHRQTIVNVICAYLRMPFSPTPPASKPEPEATEVQGEPDTETETRTAGISNTWQQETQVRLTAQRILAEHLHNDRAEDKRSTEPPSPRSWNDIRLDLTGATLIDFSLRNGVIDDADFDGATFSGSADFGGATFNGHVGFSEATFNAIAYFSGATFTCDVEFQGATFIDMTLFERTTFNAYAGFTQATFNGRVGFHATFNGLVWFLETTFSSDASFEGTTFNGDAEMRQEGRTEVAWFDKAIFHGSADFDGTTYGGATFGGDAMFKETTFGGDAMFEGVTFGGKVLFDEAIFTGKARFATAIFSSGGGLSFDRSRVRLPDAEHVWPTGWCLGPDGEGGYTVVRVNDDDGS